MIVQMSKVYIVTQSHNRNRLLDALGQLGVMHVEPVDPGKAVAKEVTLGAISTIKRGLHILQGIEPSGDTPDLSPLETAKEAISIQKKIADQEDHLNTLHRKARQLTLWGNVELKQLEQLRSTGIDIKFFSIAQKDLAELQAECVETVAELPGRNAMVAIVDRTGNFQAPEGAKEISWPETDLPTVKKEAAEVDASIKQHNKRLAELANLTETMSLQIKHYQAEAEVCVVQNSGLSSDALFALQGWTPSRKADSLSGSLAKQNITAAVEVMPAEEDDKPPTLIEYPRWSRPIKALFDMLGTLPGYEENDVSSFFMVALPIFAAMLIGDAGYGIILAGAGLVFYRRIVRLAGKPTAHLLIIFGLATMLWGILTANYFGITPQTLIDVGHKGAANVMLAVAPLWRSNGEEARALIMKVSLIIGCVHLVLAHLFTAIKLFPDKRAYAEIAWAVILIDMLVLIWYLMFIGVDQLPAAITIVLLIGFLAASWFTAPMSNPLKRFLIGFASSILPLLSTFSDIMSYIRLFAVGLASYYIASAFNGLGAKVAGSATWIGGAPIVLFGHALNLGLAAIAIFAHGVRLNMLEFSNNAGIKWAGYAYRPFTKNKDTSIGENEL
jgi:V/A-type H+-transporting ATPase subunit I